MYDTNKIPAEKLAEYFSGNLNTNFIISDLKLADKSSFDLSNKTNSYVPKVLINSTDNEMANSFSNNGQNKVSKSENNHDSDINILNAAIVQALLENPFGNKQTDIFFRSGKKSKTRLLVKRGEAHVALQYNNIALIFTKDKLVYVIDPDSKKYSVDKTLTELEEELDASIFFRANRQYIININFVKSFKAFQRVKLLLDMDVPELEEPVVISQQVAPVFKKWMNDA